MSPIARINSPVSTIFGNSSTMSRNRHRSTGLAARAVMEIPCPAQTRSAKRAPHPGPLPAGGERERGCNSAQSRRRILSGRRPSPPPPRLRGEGPHPNPPPFAGEGRVGACSEEGRGEGHLAKRRSRPLPRLNLGRDDFFPQFGELLLVGGPHL